MQELVKWLSSNQIASITLIVSFGLLTVSFCIIYIISFLQGREISFWPPKIGQKPSKGGKPESKDGIKMFDGAFIEENKNNNGNIRKRIIEGVWKSSYCTEHNPERKHEHLIELKQSGEFINGISMEGSSSPHSFKISGKIRFGIYFAGVWESKLEESVYHGTFQCIIDSAGKKMSGKWLGTGTANPVNVGDWILEKIEKK